MDSNPRRWGFHRLLVFFGGSLLAIAVLLAILFLANATR
jgi:hypothetical protein